MGFLVAFKYCNSLKSNFGWSLKIYFCLKCFRLMVEEIKLNLDG